MVILAFIFQSGISTQMTNQEFLLNCPYPLSNEVATLVNIVDGKRLNYTTTIQTVVDNYNGTYFECRIDPITKQPSANTVIKPYGKTLFNTIPTGWYAYVGDSIQVFFSKVQPILTIIYLFYIAPAVITSISWFAYINVILTIMIIGGILLAIRG